MIRVGEGTTGNVGYETLFGGKSFIKDFNKDWSDHPQIKISSGSLVSSAAGAYQVMGYTWSDKNTGVKIRNKYNITDFSPVMQDKFAVGLLKDKVRGNPLNDIATDKIQAAIEKCSWEWASLPPGRYGQPSETMDKALEYYSKYLEDEELGESDLFLEEGFIREYGY